MRKAIRWCRTSSSTLPRSRRRRKTSLTASSARANTARCLLTRTSCSQESASLRVDLRTLLHELDRLLLHSLLDVIAHVLRDLHRAEMRPAHRAEVGHLGTVLRQRLVMEFFRRVGIEAQVELVLPAEFEARLR